jgi:hypothetical protein
MDFNLLLSKLESIFNVFKWSTESVGIVVTSKRDALNLTIAFVIILWEIISPRYSSTDNDYRYLRKPLLSTFVFFYVSIAFVGFGVEPIYGDR